jgi:hypothetical protein
LARRVCTLCSTLAVGLVWLPQCWRSLLWRLLVAVVPRWIMPAGCRVSESGVRVIRLAEVFRQLTPSSSLRYTPRAAGSSSPA